MISNDDEIAESDHDGSLFLGNHMVTIWSPYVTMVNSSPGQLSSSTQTTLSRQPWHQVRKRQAMHGVRLNCHAANVPGQSGDLAIYVTIGFSVWFVHIHLFSELWGCSDILRTRGWHCFRLLFKSFSDSLPRKNVFQASTWLEWLANDHSSGNCFGSKSI